MSLSSQLLEDELIKWVEEYGEDYTNEKGYTTHTINLKKRKELFTILLNTLKDLGAEKDNFKNGPTRDKIVKASAGAKTSYKSKKTYNTIMSCGFKDLDRAIYSVFGTDSEYRKNEPEKIVEESKVPSLQEKIENELESEMDKADISEPVKTEVETLFTKVFDPSRVTDEPTVIDNTDPEMDKFLGFDDE